jgi:hypothetical protein
MTLGQKIRLIDDLIREDSDHNIRDYLETVAEIENIEKENKKTMAHPGISDEERERIILLASKMTVKEIRAGTSHAFSTIYRVLNEEKIKFHRMMMKRRKKDLAKEPVLGPVPEIRKRDKNYPTTDFKRPPCEYSNQGFLSTIQKYAI